MSKKKADIKELQKFAIILFLALGVWGGILLWRKRDIGFVLWGVGSATLLIAWIQPRFLSPVYNFWMKLTLILGFISSHLILALLYYLVLTPMGLLMRIFGKTPLSLQLDDKAITYWKKRKNSKHDNYCPERMF